jgi:hypothetical protein
VPVLRTRPETVLDDYQRAFELAGGAEALDPDWRANTVWGQLFARYQQEGHLAG